MFTQLHKTFMIESYFRNGRKVEGEWQYSVSDCLEEFRNEFPNLAVDENSFRCTLRRVVQVFRDTGSVGRKEGTGLTTKRTPELTENVRQIMDDAPSLRVLSQLTGVSNNTAGDSIQMLREFVDDRIISLNTEHEFPPRSRDITPCDFFLWPFLKNSIFKVPINNLAHLQEQISEKINEINQNPLMLQNVFNGVRRRSARCLDSG
ncbi:hypothetical protein BDFB_014303, partial [Asbolus verrucosus]